MSEVKVTETVAAPAVRVWEVLGDFGGVLKWGGKLLQRCEAYDAAGRSLSYSIVGKSPVPIRNYFSTVKVIEQGPNACRIDWQGTFEPDGVPEEQAQAMVRGIYTGGIAGARKLLGVA